MATLALAAAGAAVGSALLPTGVTVLGATLTGAAIGTQVGALAGSLIDQSLFASSGRTRTYEGPRLAELQVTTSTEGAPIPRVYGRARVGGEVIWATDFEEEVVHSSSGGGGGGKGLAGGSAPRVETTEYRYYANFAVALGEGEITSLGRVWADGQELDLSQITHRFYTGSQTQDPDSLIVAREGADAAPAYRAVAYVVFERLALAPFGNRIPQLAFEIVRPVDSFKDLVRGVVIIPGSGEFVYATQPVTRNAGAGVSVPENVHTRQGGTDWTVAIDQLESSLPNAAQMSLVVSWFGTDLRAGTCQIRPGVEIADKATSPLSWSVAGQSRQTAHIVSTRQGRPAYGGTPSDTTVVAAIKDLKARGKSVTLTPMMLMDIAETNQLPNPYTGAAAQPAYPWRGRITLDPAPGVAGSPDKTAAALAQVQAFVGTATPAHFSVSGESVGYAGPQEWTYRRYILHYAHLAKAAGGVDAFIIGTEMRALTTLRDGPASYPFVAALVTLAADVKAVLGPTTKVTYAADWSEYFGHQPADGTGDVFFHLDPLWSSPDIDAIGIDLYWPLSDWRDGRDHLDYAAGARAIHDLAYLKGNIRGGEGFDWYYASAADRDAQIRTPITDGQHGKPWVFRFKDLDAWWSNTHIDRPGGVEQATPTSWLPQSKPIWFMETGCPAIDKGANQPNVFVDPKSAESSLPYFSSGARDDLIQRRYLQAIYEAFDPDHAGYVPDLNPTSVVYGGRMVDIAYVHTYAWDARPYPAYPADGETWGDVANWRLGHWLNGRLANAALDRLVAQILNDHGFTAFDVSELAGTVPGFVVDRIMSAREALQPLELAFFFDGLESDGRIAFRHRGLAPVARTLREDDLVEIKPDSAVLTLTRGQETDLPAATKITYLAGLEDYRQAVAEARRLVGASGRIAQAALPMVLDDYQAEAIAECFLFEAWAARERATFALAPSDIALEPGDVVALSVGDDELLFRITEIGDSGTRTIEARSIDPDVYGFGRSSDRPTAGADSGFLGAPLVHLLDLPLLRGDEPVDAGYVAATATPWPGGVALYRSPETTGYTLAAIAGVPAVMGSLLDPLTPGPEGRLDHRTPVRVHVAGGALSSVTRLQMLSGQNVAAIGVGNGRWEVIQFETAELVAADTYALSGLLRGQAGTEDGMGAIAPGAPFVLLAQGLNSAGADRRRDRAALQLEGGSGIARYRRCRLRRPHACLLWARPCAVEPGACARHPQRSGRCRLDLDPSHETWRRHLGHRRCPGCRRWRGLRNRDPRRRRCASNADRDDAHRHISQRRTGR